MTINNPNSILELLFLSALSVSGAAILWRKILIDHPRLKRSIKNRMGYWSGMLLCGSCFTYWLGLLFILMLDPLSGWSMGEGAMRANAVSHYILSWMALSCLSLIFRFVFVLIQQVLHEKVHAHGGH